MTSIELLRQQKTAWVSAEDFATLLKLGVKMGPAKECLLKGVHGKYGETLVYIDRLLKPGQMRLVEGPLVDVKF